MGDFYDHVRSRRNIETAARWVCGRGQASLSREIRAEAEAFKERWTGEVISLQAALRERRFRFKEQRGVFVPRPGKKPRPIIVAPIRNRIVQRAILQVLQGVPSIGIPGVPAVRDMLAVPWSVGGIEGVDAGIALVVEARRAGAAWYLKADIPDFFTKIPVAPVLDFIRDASGDAALTELTARGLETALVNRDRLTDDLLALLPGADTGVAQGSALSALAGNILLRDFDKQLQGRGVRCVRYVDDFIILAANRRNAERAFASAQRILTTMDMKAYEPGDGSGKAYSGPVSEGIEFLGCRLDGGLISPAPKARQALLARVDELLDEGRATVRRAAKGDTAALRGPREVQVIRQVDLAVHGWGQAFRFCNADAVLKALDVEIQAKVARFRRQNAKFVRTLPPEERARVTGVTRLVDIPRRDLVISPRVTASADGA
ncbi:reverse transcriptase domain-containing protein [Plastoroseomonas hellenica]|uniref:reverse transcriptase domain-containing protein n=1 Tax=Plastoroseomonas hellenica TaxID=2687306 RepID=UPI001BAA9435|nr:reverse transcriptase domain-containing protein [Plastoroseomonas hellenica]MBR0641942.1 hypothetical protein [Plastoroseomonas hellenica]